MKCVFVLASVSLGLLASPVAAQELAHTAPVAVAPAPPPFPPMPSAKPSHRYVDMGEKRSRARSKVAPTRHAASAKRDTKAKAAKKVRASKATHKSAKASKSAVASRSHKAEASRSRKAEASRRTVRKEKTLHFSAKTVRQCHGMTYKQIMGHSSCRAMIKQELAASPNARSTKHQAAARRTSTRHRTAAKRRRR